MNYKNELELCEHTLLLKEKQYDLIPKNSGHRCIRSTIINRAYYPTFLFVGKYITEKGIKIHDIKYYKINHKKFVTEHQQVIDGLNQKNKYLSSILFKLKNLRIDADYYPNKKIKIRDINEAVDIMNETINTLKFNK